MRRDYEASLKEAAKINNIEKEEENILRSEATNLASWEEPYPAVKFSGGEWQKARTPNISRDLVEWWTNAEETPDCPCTSTLSKS